MFHRGGEFGGTGAATQNELDKIEDLVEGQCFYGAAEITANGIEFRVPFIQRTPVDQSMLRSQYLCPNANNIWGSPTRRAFRRTLDE